MHMCIAVFLWYNAVDIRSYMKQRILKELYFFVTVLFFALYSIVFLPGRFASNALAAPLSGGDADMDIYLFYNSTTWVDDTTDAADPGDDGDVEWLFQGGGGDFAYFGHTTTSFDRIIFDVSSASFGGAIQDFQYWTGSVWSSLGHTSNTSPFLSTGTNNITFTIPPDWTTTTVSTTAGYFVRLESGDGNTFASIDQISIRVANAPTSTITSNPTVMVDGSGGVSLNLGAFDRDYDSDIRLQVKYDAGADCTTSTAVTSTINSLMTFGFASFSLSVDNYDSDGYQINNIDTSAGPETVTTQWSSGVDVPNADGQYCIFITANDDNYTGPTVTTTVTLDNVDPTTPGNLTINTTSTNSVTFNLPTTTSTDTNFSEYKIYYKAGSSGVTSADNSHTQFDDANLGDGNFNGANTTQVSNGFVEIFVTNTQYVANIYALDSFGNSAAATELAFYTLAGTPGQLSLSAGGPTTMTATFAQDGNPSGTTYALYDVTTGSYIDATGDAGSLTWQTTSTWSGTTLSGLATSSPYCYQTVARNGDGVQTATSTVACAYTAAAQPSAPTISGPTTSTLNLALNINGNSTSTNFAIYNVTDGNYIAASGASSATAVWQSTSTWTSSLTMSGFATNTAYTFAVVARNAASVTSATSSANAAVYTLAAIPINPASTANSATAITFSWDANGNPGTTEYYAEDAAAAGTNSGWSTNTSYQFTGLSASTAYTFKVKARNGDNVETVYATAAAATTQAAASSGSSNSNGGGGGGVGSSSLTVPTPSSQQGVGTGSQASGSSFTSSMGVGSSISFSSGGNLHSLTFNTLSGSRASFTLQSDPIDFELAVGEENVFDLDGDSTIDVHVYLASIENGEAQVEVTRLEDYAVVINDGLRSTASKTVKVQVNPVVNIMHVAYSLSPSFAGATFETYTEDPKYLTFANTVPGEKTVYVRLRDSKGATAVVSDSILYDPVAVGCPLQREMAYKSAASNAVYYVTADCTKRAFTRSAIFFTYFQAWSDVKLTTGAMLARIPNDVLGFMPYGPLYDPQYGALVKITSDPKVYLLLGGNKHWITSESIFNALGYQWNWIEDIDPRLLNKYQTMGEITDTTRHPNYTLVKYADDPRVYRLEPVDGTTVKRHIANEAAFNRLKYRWDRIVTIPTSETYPDGAQLTQ